MSDFPVQNLPYGVFPARDWSASIGVAIEDYILDLRRHLGCRTSRAPLPPETRSACACAPIRSTP